MSYFEDNQGTMGNEWGHYGYPSNVVGCPVGLDYVFYSNTQSWACLPKGLSQNEIIAAEREAFAQSKNNDMGSWYASTAPVQVSGVGSGFDGVYTVDQHYHGVPVYRKGGYVLYKRGYSWHIVGPGGSFAPVRGDGGIDYPYQATWSNIWGGLAPSVTGSQGGGTIVIPNFPLAETPSGPEPWETAATVVVPHTPLGPAYWESRGLLPDGTFYQSPPPVYNPPPPPPVPVEKPVEDPVYTAPTQPVPVYNPPPQPPEVEVEYKPNSAYIPPVVVDDGGSKKNTDGGDIKPVQYLGPPISDPPPVYTLPVIPAPFVATTSTTLPPVVQAAGGVMQNLEGALPDAVGGNGTIFGYSPLMVIGVGAVALILFSSK